MARKRKGKWPAFSDPDQLFTKTARRAIRERLENMWHYLPLAGKRAEENVEYVHQLRVYSRRTASALRVFGELLPHKKHCELKRIVRKVRRAANDARDLDVLLGRLASSNDTGALKPLIRQIKRERKQAQKPLLKLYKRAKSKKWISCSLKLTREVRWRGPGKGPKLRAGARPALHRAVDDFFTAARADLTDIEAIHQMRIRGKHLRYTMELLAGAFDESFRKELYPVFSSVQEKLGKINDHATAATFFREWKSRSDRRSVVRVLDQRIAKEDELLDSTASEFRQWWTEDRASQLVTRFDAFLFDEPVPMDTAFPNDSDASCGENGQSRNVPTVSPTRQELTR